MNDRIFYVDEVRKWINQLLKEEISISKFVEMLNEKATGLSAIEMYRMSVERYKKEATCQHYFVQTDAYWKRCNHCGMIAPLGQ